MGLDMYLTAKRYVSEYSDKDKSLSDSITPFLPEFRGRSISGVSARVAYWRKANAIHSRFVQNVQEGVDDCREAYVSREDLAALVSACESVLADPSRASNNLGTRGGFFFGSTEYNEYYFETLRYTVETLKPLVENPLNNCELYYHSSW